MKVVLRLTASCCSFAFLIAAAVGSAQGPHAPPIRTLTEQEMVDMMVGSSIQATRSSNSEVLIKRVHAAVAQGQRFKMIAVDDMPNDWTVVIPSAIGGGGAWEYVRERAERQKLALVEEPMLRAIEALSRHIGRPFQAVVRTEAAGSTLTAFLTASALGVPVVDACVTGRAVPEMQQSVPFINGLSASPAAMVTRWGDTILLDRTVDDYRLEDLGRAVAVASGGGVQMANSPLTAAQLKRGVIRGSVSEAILYGRTVREAREKGRDPIAALLTTAQGFELFRGIVTKADMKGDRGFTWWDVELTGTGRYRGHSYKVFVKNENIVTWLDGNPDAMSPDLISNLDPRTGDAITSQGLGGYQLNTEVVMVGLKASPLWRTPKGVEVLGPRHFGFDFDYIPIEQLQNTRPKFASR
jgi:DUF917 family protein